MRTSHKGRLKGEKVLKTDDFSMVSICLIVAASKNWVIGNNGKIPWYLPEDLKYFRIMTIGKPIIMGRKTFESIGRSLPHRDNIIVTRNLSLFAQDALICDSIVSALKSGVDLAQKNGVQEIMVIGGGQIYVDAIRYCSRIYLTEVHKHYCGDVKFPELHPDDWREVSRESIQVQNSDQPPCSYIILDRVGLPEDLQ